MEIKERVESYRSLLLERLSELVSINSVESEPVEHGPFGIGPSMALDRALQMLEEDGLRVVNLDHMVGYGEIGAGDESIGVITHLDVVPAKKEDGWLTDPFIMTEKDGMLYGRGVADDKGALVASMIAVKVIQDMNVSLNKRIRLIFGTNEETGSRCLAHYVEKEGDVTYGFTPDGDFPGTYGEKGILVGVYRCRNSNIIHIEGGTASNVVPASCTVELKKCCYSEKKLKDFFHNHDFEYKIESGENSDRITLFGYAAHASTPEKGTNAISWLMLGLKESGCQDPFVKFYCQYFGVETDGRRMHMDCHDEYGALTMNNGVVRMSDGVIEGTIDIRFPVTYSARQVKNKYKDLEIEGGEIEMIEEMEPLFFSPDSDLVTALHKAYVDVTGDTAHEPTTMGGGTYAKEIGNTIAFGCAFPGVSYHLHEPNECCSIDDLLLQAEIYVHAIMNLLEL